MAIERVHIGLLTSGAYGIRVSKPGVAVGAGGLGDFVFATDFQEYAVVHAQGEISLDSTSDEVVTFPDLGYVPMCMFQASKDSGVTWHPSLYIYNSSVSSDTFPRVRTTATSLTVFADSSRGHGSYLVRYTVFRVRAV